MTRKRDFSPVTLFVWALLSAVSFDGAHAQQQAATSRKPNAPTGLVATAINANQVNLTWRDNADNETGYEIWMLKNAAGDWARQSTTPANATNWGFGGLPAGTSCAFRVYAVNGAGHSTTFAEATCTIPRTTPAPVQAPSITVISPKGSPNPAEQEQWLPGTTHSIKWTYTGDIGPTVRIELFIWQPKGIRTSRILGLVAPEARVQPGGVGSYDWVVPLRREVIEPEYKVNIKSISRPNVYNESGYFSIPAPLVSESELFAPDMTLLAPKEGETWTTGSVQTIRWNYRGTPPGRDVKIALLDSPTSQFVFLTRGTPVGTGGSGAFTYTIPAEWPAGSYTLSVRSTVNESYRGDRKITLARPEAKIVVAAPDRGTRWVGGSTQVVRWTYTGDVGAAHNVGLFLRGASVAVLATEVRVSTSGASSATFTVPKGLPAMGEYTVRVIAPLKKVVGESAPFRVQ